MALKPTKRKAFSFLRSYFDVLNEIPDDKDKLTFLLSIINKQFLNDDPQGLNFVCKLAYESQRHQIETSVKGYKSKTKDPMKAPCQGGSQAPCEAPCLQEEEEEKEDNFNSNNYKILENVFKTLKERSENKNSIEYIKLLEIEKSMDISRMGMRKCLQDFKSHLLLDDVVHLTTNELLKHFRNWMNTQDTYGKLNGFKNGPVKGDL
jgi:hypothetical protein